MRWVAGLVFGLVIAILGMLVVTFAMSGPTRSGAASAPISFLLFWIVSIVIAVTAPSTGKAWRRLLITAAIVSLMLPLSGIVFTGAHVSDAMQTSRHPGAAATGALIGGGIAAGFMGIVGFFLGAVFLIVGLLVGREKQVVYVHAPAPVELPKT